MLWGALQNEEDEDKRSGGGGENYSRRERSWEKSRIKMSLENIASLFINRQKIVDLFSAFLTSQENSKSKRGEESLHI